MAWSSQPSTTPTALLPTVCQGSTCRRDDGPENIQLQKGRTQGDQSPKLCQGGLGHGVQKYSLGLVKTMEGTFPRHEDPHDSYSLKFCISSALTSLIQTFCSVEKETQILSKQWYVSNKSQHINILGWRRVMSQIRQMLVPWLNSLLQHYYIVWWNPNREGWGREWIPSTKQVLASSRWAWVRSSASSGMGLYFVPFSVPLVSPLSPHLDSL